MSGMGSELGDFWPGRDMRRFRATEGTDQAGAAASRSPRFGSGSWDTPRYEGAFNSVEILKAWGGQNGARVLLVLALLVAGVLPLHTAELFLHGDL